MMTASEAFAVAGVRLEGKKHFKYGLLVEKIDGGAAFTADGLFFQLWVHRAKGWPHWEAVEPNVGVDKLKLAPGDWVAFVHTARPRS